MFKTLIEFESWSVCETDEDTHSNKERPVEVYAEHYRDCDDGVDNDDNDDNRYSDEEYKASWSWEFDDPPNSEGHDICWECGGRVPEEAVALVQLYNWGRKHRGENA